MIKLKELTLIKDALSENLENYQTSKLHTFSSFS